MRNHRRQIRCVVPSCWAFTLASLAALVTTTAGCATQGEVDSWDDNTMEDGKADDFAPVGNTAYPIVLAHGWDASPTNRWGFYGVAEALRADGHTVIVAQVPPYASAETRASYLKTVIDETLAATNASKVNIIAHSMGGLDARIVASPDGGGLGPQIATVTTISSPHRGSSVGDVALKLTSGASDKLLDALATAWGKTYSELATDTAWKASLHSISTAGAATINQTYRNSPTTKYQSYAGVATLTGLTPRATATECGRMVAGNGKVDRVHLSLAPMAAVVNGTSFPLNDGLVTVASAKFGAFRGCIPADHMEEVGQPKQDLANDRTGFDHILFYRRVAADLASRGM
jgi:triacylglycerol lipase